MVTESKITVLIDTDLFYRGKYDAAKHGQSGYLNSYERAYNDFLTKFAYDVIKANFDLSFIKPKTAKKDDLFHELENNFCFTLAHSIEKGPVEFIFNSIVDQTSLSSLQTSAKVFFVTDKFLPQEDDERVFENKRKNGKVKTLPFNEIVKDKLTKSDSLPAFTGYEFIHNADISEISDFKNLKCVFINPLIPIMHSTEKFLEFLSQHQESSKGDADSDGSPFGKGTTFTVMEDIDVFDEDIEDGDGSPFGQGTDFNVVKEYDKSPDFSDDGENTDTHDTADDNDSPFGKGTTFNVVKEYDVSPDFSDDEDDYDIEGEDDDSPFGKGTTFNVVKQYDTGSDRDYQFLNLDEIKIHYPDEAVDPWDKLDNFIGMKNIKQQLMQIKRRMEFDLKRREKGFKEQDKPSNHFVFYGNPGTGKNEVSRILGSLMKNMGVLSKGHVIEVDRSDLIMGYIGQSAIKTKEILTEARGGILFIDEAYSLWDGSSWDFGPEVISTLMKHMEDQREDLVIIFAGYKEEMEILLRSNPGFSSRIRHHLEFLDYNTEELIEIYKKFCEENSYKIHKDAMVPVKNIMTESKKLNNMKFGNGRFVRNVFEKTIEKLATRVINMNLETDEDLELIRPTDIPNIEEVTKIK